MDINTPKDETIFSRIQTNLQRFGKKPFLRVLEGNGDSGASGTYAGVIQRCLNWMELYRQKGLRPQDRVVIILPHSFDLYVSYLGAVLSGIVPTLFHFPSPKLSRQSYFASVGQLLENADARLIVTYPAIASAIQEELRKQNSHAEVCTSDDTPKGLLNTFSAFAAQADDIAFLQYSSGTTGLKKGVAISHRALLQQIDAYAHAIRLQPHDVIVSWLPLYHDMGLIACYWLPFLTATPLIAMSPFDWVQRPGMLWEVCTKQRPTLCWLPNFAYNHMVRSISDSALNYYDLRSLRGMINCSEPILDHSHEIFLKRFQSCGLSERALWTCYAMAENTFAVTQGGPQGPVFVDCIDGKAFATTGKAVAVEESHPHARKYVSSGVPLPHTTVEIHDSQGQTLPERTQGEIVISSPSLMQGYFRSPNIAVPKGRFATGDLGYLANGELIVTGRKKDLIIIAGKNIYPQDIEAIVSTIPGAIPGRCVALGLDDRETGTEELIVLVETHEETPKKRARLRQQISDAIARQTEVVARDLRLLPHRWLAKSSSGKIARTANLERYRRELQDDTPTEQTAIFDDEKPAISRMRTLLSQALAGRSSQNIADIYPEQSLISSGVLDSLSLINLIVEIESQYQIQLPSDIQTDLSRFDSLKSLTELVDELCAAPPCDRDEAEELRLSVRSRKTMDFANGPRDFDLIILGSSRVDGLSCALAKQYGYKAFNFAVNSAQAEDWYCITRFVQDYNKIPLKRILLGIDIEAFNGLHSPDERLITCPLLRPYLGAEDIEEVENIFPADKGLSALVAELSTEKRQRFQEIFTQLRAQNITASRDFDYHPESGDLLFKDAGVLKAAYDKRLSLCIQGLNTVDDLGTHQRATELRLKQFDQLFPRRVRYFEQLVFFCEEQQIQLSCFLTPMHPLLQELLKVRTNYTARIQEFRELFDELFTPFCELVDCSSPELFGGNNVDFRDEAHVGPYNSDKLLAHLLANTRHTAC